MKKQTDKHDEIDEQIKEVQREHDQLLFQLNSMKDNPSERKLHYDCCFIRFQDSVHQIEILKAKKEGIKQGRLSALEEVEKALFDCIIRNRKSDEEYYDAWDTWTKDDIVIILKEEIAKLRKEKA